ncbi:preprotein translocase subunit SecA [Candidatus Cytomitobacter primus]|uniref:Protein translocase subunit SecA n=1 Tax=Candidatus Cytomitobacter primus TaxID=2066024 RepID=A0A5C0UGD0_9PROT|nr:preprotein translocase subunit SecA [Candidatus Cytomitobacter primus]QEK38342.1 preprotein translocase subunit SecA [Candidatus Cytomitobacter primus]
MFKFITNLFKRLFWSSNKVLLHDLWKIVDQIDQIDLSDLTDQDLSAMTITLKERLKNGESVDDILVDAFAIVREAAHRVLNERPYRVQLLGGIALHKGMISEMKTGEGKTLVAVLPAYLNALTGEGVHVVTVNDYLAERDSKWVGKVFKFLGMSVGCILHHMGDEARKQQYACDITYATNNELGFDYLRDNLKMNNEEVCQRKLHCAIVDEIDNILIDEARTPLIISGPSEESSGLYNWVQDIVSQLNESHYEKDEKNHTVTLNEDGMHKIEDVMREEGVLENDKTLYDHQHIALVHHINQALKANTLFVKNVHYMVSKDEVNIIDEFTGRIMHGRRYSDGLHQALEAKENVEIQKENHTLASITFQRLFRMYDKLCGMTGTASTEAEEFEKTYNLSIAVIPTNKKVVRIDHEDEIYRTLKEKINAVVALVKICNAKKQPVLLGTSSVEKSQLFAQALTEHGILHRVLNAKNHANEAKIIANAGKLGHVTVVTNMAGRGTDIKLGGNAKILVEDAIKDIEDSEQAEQVKVDIIQQIDNERNEVLKAGGLFVIGTERHESRRIDNQLRGRAGRQGDKGESKFFLCLEDDLMRIFASGSLDSWLKTLGLKEGEAITHKMVTRAISKAQKRVEAHNFDIRQQMKKYADIKEDQMSYVYSYRKDVLLNFDFTDLQKLVDSVVTNAIQNFLPQSKDWDEDKLSEYIESVFGIEVDIKSAVKDNAINQIALSNYIIDKLSIHFEQFNNEQMVSIAKMGVLQSIDDQWRSHVQNLDYLKQGISLKGYAQKDPLVEYKKESFELFESIWPVIYENSIRNLINWQRNMSENMQNSMPDNNVSENPDISSINGLFNE